MIRRAVGVRRAVALDEMSFELMVALLEEHIHSNQLKSVGRWSQRRRAGPRQRP
jgi:hypothetical protein